MLNLRSLVRLLTAACLFGLASHAHAAVEPEHFNLESTEHLYLVCSVAEEDEHYLAAIMICRGFLEGTVQYHDAIVGEEQLKPLICHGGGATIGEAREAFVAWANENQDDAFKMSEQPVVGVVRALAVKYPCQ